MGRGILRTSHDKLSHLEMSYFRMFVSHTHVLPRYTSETPRGQVGLFPRAFLVIRPKQLDPRVLRLSTICHDWFGVLTPRALLLSLQIISELAQTAYRLGTASPCGERSHNN